MGLFDSMLDLIPGCGSPRRSTSKLEIDEPKSPVPDAQLDADAGRAFTKRKKRRVAVASENTEMVAQVRWQSAFEAMKSYRFKLPQHVYKIQAVLNSHAIFSKLEPDVLNQVVQSMRVVKVEPGEEVIKKGDAGDAFYVVGEGELEAFLDGPDAVATYGPGGSFGELALLYNAPRAATVKAKGKCLLFRLGRMAFRNLVSTAVEKSKSGLEERLAKVPILAGIEMAQAVKLVAAMESVTFEDGATLATAAKHPEALYVILMGEVACDQADGSSTRLGPGSVIGEDSLDTPRDTSKQPSIVAVGSVRCARLVATDAINILGSLQAARDIAFTRKIVMSVEHFQSLSTRQVAEMIARMTYKTLKKGDVAIAQGATGTHFYVVRSGSVDVLVGEASKKVATLKEGKFFGERSLLKAEPANATVMAAETTDLLGLSKADFEELLGPLQSLIEKEAARREAEIKAKGSTKYTWADLDMRTVLGEGSFGVVRIAVHKPSGQPFALKALHKGHIISTNQITNTINEKTLMKQVDHPLVLKCYATFNQKNHINLLLGLALGGELFTRMQTVGTLSPKKASFYVAMVASALGFLSERHIAHRDLKLENLMIDETGYLKLVDFGFAKIIESRTWTFCGTPDYLAPEILSQQGHNYAVDWWALGVLTYEMMHGEPPFMEDDQMRTFKRISNCDYQMERGLDASAVDMITRQLSLNPAKRLGMLSGGDKNVTGHPLCAHINMEKLLKKELTPPYVPQLRDAMDTSNFDDIGTPSSGNKYNKFIDAKYEPKWEAEFGEKNN